VQLSDYLADTYIPARLDLSAGAAEQLQIACRLLDRWLGRPATLSDLSAKTLADWMRHLAETRAPRTVNAKRAAIVAIWNDAAAEGLVPPPPRRLPRLNEPARLPEAFSMADMARLMEACRRVKGSWGRVPASLYWHLAVSLIWDTAVRLGSLLDARLAEVDPDAGTWHVPAEHIKGRRGDRLFRLHPDTLALVAQSIELEPDRELLFPYPRRRRQVWTDFGAILEAAGLPSSRRHKFHCLRRTSESHAAAAAGVDYAAAAVGHTLAVAQKHYIAPAILPQPSLVDVLPRPEPRV